MGFYKGAASKQSVPGYTVTIKVALAVCMMRRVGGASPLFSPIGEQEAKLHLDQRLSSIAEYMPGRSRWTLEGLLAACTGQFRLHSLSGLWRLLRRLGIHYQRARTYYHSPDPAYAAKLEYVLRVIGRYQAGKVVVLFADELTYYNHASPAAEYAPIGHQPKAGLAIGGERTWRAVAAVDAYTGRVISTQGHKVTVAMFVRFLQKVAEAYADALVIYLILDNWPVHFHPDVMEALVEQEWPFPYLLPKTWMGLAPKGKYKNLKLPIQLVPLPTYASWLNPVEKIWRATKQGYIHNHSLANNFKELIRIVGEFLAGLEGPSQRILSLVGLLNPQGVFASALSQGRNHQDSS